MPQKPGATIVSRPTSSRLHDLDSLRALASFFIVLNHTFFNSLLDTGVPHETVEFVHPFRVVGQAFVPLRVPLFFVLAGMLTVIGLRQHSVSYIFRKRFLRILIPLAFSSLTFSFLAYASSGRLWGYGRLFSEYLQFINPVGGPGFLHLWFLAVLTFFSLISMGGALITSRFPTCNLLLRKLRNFLFSRRFLLLAIILGCAVVKIAARNRGYLGLLDFNSKLPMDQLLWNLNYFSIGALFGSDITKAYRFLFFILRGWVWILAAMILLGIAGHFGGSKVGLLLFSASANILPLMVVLSLFRRYYNICPEPLKTMSKLSYPVYILHMPVLYLISFGLFALKVEPLVIYFSVIVICYPVSLMLAHGLTRIPFFALVLQGEWRSRSRLRSSKRVEPHEIRCG